MKKEFLIITGLTFFLFSCETQITGNGSITQQTYSLSTNPTKISVEHDIDVTVKYSPTKKVKVSGSENLLDYVKISAAGGVLRIGMKPDYTYTNMDITAIVEIPSFTELAIIHEGNIIVDSLTSHITNLNVVISGSGNVSALHHPQITNLTTSLSGTGSLFINGYAANEDIHLSGTGDFTGFGLLCNQATVDLSGVGKVEVNPKLTLDANISGTGNIYFKRYPIINSTLTGTGIIIDSN